MADALERQSEKNLKDPARITTIFSEALTPLNKIEVD
jgi:hypothetical protein